MKGDFTRSTFRPEKHYSSVRMQQGRVQLDADWNEAVDLAAHRVASETLDALGPAGGPRMNAGFALATELADLPVDQRDAAADLLPLVPGDFIIAAGHYYVDGMLCENDRPVTFADQPDPSGQALPAAAGTYLAYLDVWTRHLTALEDPEIREVALGGPDTTTRTKTVWQVKLLAVSAADAVDTGAIPASLIERSTGKLAARISLATHAPDPCQIEPGMGYRRTENQLYRIEIHQRGALGTATFKWSRDNAAVAIPCTAGTGNTLILAGAVNDRSQRIIAGDCLELTDDSHELGDRLAPPDAPGPKGVLLNVLAVNGATLTVARKDSAGSIDWELFPARPKVRRWDGIGEVALPADNEGFLGIEADIEVRFTAGNYQSGDYWLIPARTAGSDILWPFDEPQAPLGIVRHYCRLAVLQFDGSRFTAIKDCRRRFPAATELLSLFYLGGDGQESGPGQLLPQPLRAGVANGQWPVAGATVRFTVTSGNGSLQGEGQSVDIITDAAGVASCSWQLGSQAANQQVRATLLDAAGSVRHLPVQFSAAISSDARDPGMHVQQIRFGDGSTFVNDGDVTVARFAKGIQLICDAKVDPRCISRATCRATLEIPYPVSASDKALWGLPVLGYQSLVLMGTAQVSDSIIEWLPVKNVRDWLEQQLFEYLKESNREQRLLTRLTLHGHFIWQADKPSLALDGDVFGIPDSAAPNRTLLQLPSGDGRRGGDLQLWCWLIETPPAAVEVTLKVANPRAPLNSQVALTVTVTGTTNTAVEFSVNDIAGGNDIVGRVVQSKPGEWAYNAPREIPPKNPVTIAVKALADPTKSASVAVTLVRVS